MRYDEDEFLFEKISRPVRARSGPNRRMFPTCSGKNTYSKQGALFAKASGLKKGVPYLRIYRCPTCRLWHLTHKQRRR